MPKVLNPRSRDTYWSMFFIEWRNIFNSNDYHSYFILLYRPYNFILLFIWFTYFIVLSIDINFVI